MEVSGAGEAATAAAPRVTQHAVYGSMAES